MDYNKNDKKEKCSLYNSMFNNIGNRNKHNISSVRLMTCSLCEEDFKTFKNVCEDISKDYNVQLIKETTAFDSQPWYLYQFCNSLVINICNIKGYKF